jgi:hypothetical protein
MKKVLPSLFDSCFFSVSQKQMPSEIIYAFVKDFHPHTYVKDGTLSD